MVPQDGTKNVMDNIIGHCDGIETKTNDQTNAPPPPPHTHNYSTTSGILISLYLESKSGGVKVIGF